MLSTVRVATVRVSAAFPRHGEFQAQHPLERAARFARAPHGRPFRIAVQHPAQPAPQPALLALEGERQDGRFQAHLK